MLSKELNWSKKFENQKNPFEQADGLGIILWIELRIESDLNRYKIKHKHNSPDLLFDLIVWTKKPMNFSKCNAKLDT